MTYNEFMKDFNQYIKARLDYELRKYPSMHQLAKEKGLAPSSITRLYQGKFRQGFDAISKILGEDIRDIDIEEAKQFEIRMLEERLKELKGEQNITL